MLKLHQGKQVLRHSENIPQDIDLKLVKRFINIGFEQRLQLVQPVLNLQLRLRINNIAILISVGDGGTVAGMRETQTLGRRGQQAGFQTGDGLVDQVIDRVDNIIYERLGGE